MPRKNGKVKHREIKAPGWGVRGASDFLSATQAGKIKSLTGVLKVASLRDLFFKTFKTASHNGSSWQLESSPSSWREVSPESLC